MPSIRCADDQAVAGNLWTRRSALALTAGFFARRRSPPARAAFVQSAVAARQPHRGLQDEPGAGADGRREDAEALRRPPRLRAGRAQDALGRRAHPGGPLLHRPPQRPQRLLPQPRRQLPQRRSTSRARARSGVRPGRQHLHPRRPAPPAERRKQDWTAGCIAVSDAEIEEIWSMVPTGIPITILA